MNWDFHLFDRFGIELEYIIVSRETLNILPISDLLLYKAAQNYSGDYQNGDIGWSNEFVLHLIELKNTIPAPNLLSVNDLFSQNIITINSALAEHDAVLMPTGMHPWMDPLKETKFWPHEGSHIYKMYDRIFECKRHGWANVQSCHLNLPFFDENEFGKLHAAIRMLLPVLPAIAASSPLVEHSITNCLNNRLKYYQTNQIRFPKITGKVIPEAVFSPDEYYEKILDPMYNTISSHDPKRILQEEWLNSRGAIARFDRGAIEIRVLDTQECPLADFSLAYFIITILKQICDEKFGSYTQQKIFSTNELYEIFDQCVNHADDAVIANENFLKFFGFQKKQATAFEFLQFLFEKIQSFMTEQKFTSTVKTILTKGPLAKRILRNIKNDLRHEKIFDIYSQLIECLQKQTLYE